MSPKGALMNPIKGQMNEGVSAPGRTARSKRDTKQLWVHEEINSTND